MKMGIVGLGLIGGSMAKAYSKTPGNTVYGFDSNNTILDYAIMSGNVDLKLTKDNIAACELILIATYPDGAAQYLGEMSPYIKKGAMVIDCLGTKQKICAVGFELAKQYGYTFIGGHPMAGTHNSGFKFSRSDLFEGAPMVLVPPVYDDMELIDKVSKYLTPCRFGKISVTTAKEHDRIIAFTSQLCHVVSNAYVKSPTAYSHSGFSAGSYRDLTRVAWLNPAMWAELFLENDEFLLFEVDNLIKSLTEYRNAIAGSDKDLLVKLLDEGRKIKEEVDGDGKNQSKYKEKL